MSMNYIKSVFAAILFISIYSCSPKTAPVIIETPVVEDPTKQEPKNPCQTFADLSNAERDEVETAYVLYKDLIKLGKYEEAFPLWTKAYYGAPASNGKVKYQFDDGVMIYTNKYNNASDTTKRQIFVDSVMSIYNKRMECFGEEAYTKGRMAFDYYYTFPGTKSEDEIYEMFKINFDVNGKNADYFVVNPFTKMLSDRIIAGTISNEEGRKYAKLIGQTVENGQANCKGVLCESWAIIADYAPARLESLEGIDGFYDCDYYADKYYVRFEEDPTNCDMINLVGRRLKRGGCAIDDPRLVKVTAAYTASCKVESPSSGLLAQAFEAYNDGRYREAIELFKQYVDGESDPAKKFKYTMVIGKIYYGDLKDFPKSRQAARDASQIDPTSGEPYMLIGKLYASSGPLCGSGRGWNSQVVTWPTIDMFTKAKNLDSNVADEANKFIRQYKQYMPTKEEIFQRRLKVGDRFKVPCWIQESTTIRSVD
ncbi:MAG: tetratricopeptide (TPR) repeat protein [Saprospiraceae bacterium]|jgi:tetratricopeptide (TPR) repeat protein